MTRLDRQISQSCKMYPFEEQVDMILIYGECQQNSVRARILYSERYPNRILSSCQTFINVCDKLRQTGSLNNRKSECEKRVTHEGNEVGVLAMIARNPHVSSRQIERESGVSKRSVLRILHRYKFHPYHLSLHQELHEMDFVNRVRFCQWAQQQIRNNESFFDTVLFTDERPSLITGTLIFITCICGKSLLAAAGRTSETMVFKYMVRYYRRQNYWSLFY